MLDMTLIVGFEVVDACLPAPELASTSWQTRWNFTSAQTSPTTMSSVSPALNIIRAGTQEPQKSLLEITSYSKYFIDQLDWKEFYPQLALSQTPGLRLGVHESGTFTELRECQVDDASAETREGGPACAACACAGGIAGTRDCARSGTYVRPAEMSRG